jgi:hypothetical protein
VDEILCSAATGLCIYRTCRINNSCFIHVEVPYHKDVPVHLTCYTTDRIACVGALTVCSFTFGKQEQCIQNFSQESRRERDYQADVGVDVKIILQLIIKNSFLKM